MNKPAIPTKPLNILDSRGMQIPSARIAQIAMGETTQKLNTPMEGVEKAFKGIAEMLGPNFRLTFVVRHETTTEDGIVLTNDELEAVAHLCLIQQTRVEKEQAGQLTQ
jgi:monoamine oxidase